MKKFMFIVIVLIFAGTSGNTQSKYGSEIFHILQSPSQNSLGGGPASSDGNVFSFLYNPAGVEHQKPMQLGFIHTQQFISDISYSFLATSFDYDSNRITLGVARIGIDNVLNSLDAYVSSGNDWGIDFSQIKSMNVADYIFIAGLVPKKKFLNFRVGFNLKYVRRNYDVAHANGIGFDIGLKRNLYRNFEMHARFANALGTLIHWSTGKNEYLYPELSYGLRYFQALKKSIRIVVIANIFHYFENRSEADLQSSLISSDMSIGSELVYNNIIGIKAGRNQFGRVVLGMMVRIPKIEFNYAYSRESELGNVHNLNIIFSLPY